MHLQPFFFGLSFGAVLVCTTISIYFGVQHSIFIANLLYGNRWQKIAYVLRVLVSLIALAMVLIFSRVTKITGEAATGLTSGWENVGPWLVGIITSWIVAGLCMHAVQSYIHKLEASSP